MIIIYTFIGPESELFNSLYKMDVSRQKELYEEAIDWYIANQNAYKKLAFKIGNIITEILEIKGIPFHMITSRAKELDSFKKKAQKDKYDDPVNQILDLAGIRIITYVEDDVSLVCKIIEDVFDINLENSLDKSQELGIDKVGYKSVHYVAKLKNDRLILPEYSSFKDKYFEIQVRTILQHAWAEIEHDRNYKFSGKLPNEIHRRFKLLAGSLEISDREFNNIAQEIDKISKKVTTGVRDGQLDIPISSTSLKQYIDVKFDKLKESGFNLDLEFGEKIINELERYGIYTLEDLDKIVPKDYIKTFIKSESFRVGEEITGVGIVRSILILNDPDKYFKDSWKNNWKVWVSSGNAYKILFDHYKVDWSNIENQYNVPYTKK